VETSRTWRWRWHDFGDHPGVFRIDGKPWFDATSIDPLLVEGPCLLLQHSVGWNYCHWHLDCLPPVVVCLDAIRAGRLRLLSQPLQPWQQRSLERLGVPATAICETEDEAVACRDLIVHSNHAGMSASFPGALAREAYRRIVAGGTQEPDTSAPPLIYIARSDMRDHARIMRNEDALIDALGGLGFDAILPGRMTLDQQIATFSGARIIVGPHGAGLANIGYAPRDCFVIEIKPDIFWGPFVRHLTALLGQRYACVQALIPESDRMPVEVGGEIRTDLHFDYEAPVDRVVQAVRAAMALLA
jgi:capsular polysaccharide biosynthesis protein